VILTKRPRISFPTGSRQFEAGLCVFHGFCERSSREPTETEGSDFPTDSDMPLGCLVFALFSLARKTPLACPLFHRCKQNGPRFVDTGYLAQPYNLCGGWIRSAPAFYLYQHYIKKIAASERVSSRSVILPNRQQVHNPTDSPPIAPQNVTSCHRVLAIVLRIRNLGHGD